MVPGVMAEHSAAPWCHSWANGAEIKPEGLQELQLILFLKQAWFNNTRNSVSSETPGIVTIMWSKQEQAFL